MIRLSPLAASVKPSATLAAGAKAWELRSRGVVVHDFSLGEPDFDTPAHIQAAAAAAMKAGKTHYTPASGSIELRKAIATWYQRKYGLERGPENIFVSNGARHSIHNIIAAAIAPGDEVLIPAPCWVSYGEIVAMVGGKPVYLPTTFESGFKLTPEQVRAAMTERTRLLLLNSPCNPTGTVLSRDELRAVTEAFLSKEDTFILSDEIYEQLTYDSAEATCVATLSPAHADRIVTVSGASKSYAMTGWRLGWTVAPPEFIKALDSVQSQETGCPSSIAQAAVAATLNDPESDRAVESMRREFAERRNLAASIAREIPGVEFVMPEGAFYIFFRVESLFGKSVNGRQITDSVSFCTALLEAAHVNLVPGSAFGAEGYARLSFATSRTTIEAGMTAFRDWVRSL